MTKEDFVAATIKIQKDRKRTKEFHERMYEYDTQQRMNKEYIKRDINKRLRSVN